jgi:hypothetical protein
VPSTDDVTRQFLEQAWTSLIVGRAHEVERPALELAAAVPSAGLASHFRVAEAAVGSVGVALLAAAALSAQRNGRLPGVAVHPGQVGAAVRSERYFRVAGDPTGPGFAPLSRFWPTRDGWLRTHANYPWHRSALLDALGTEADAELVAAAMRELPAPEIESRVVDAGGVAGAVRSNMEWATHPQGRAVAAEPLVGHRSFPGAPPRACRPGGLPADGVRVLDLTRVIAGPVCTRYLGALGAAVLRIDPPRRPDIAPGAIADTLLAKRSAPLDLGRSGAIQALHRLIDQADVVVCGYRPGSLNRFGLAADDLAARHPGLVLIYLSAWGHTGPWAKRRGFDSVVQAPTGIAIGESLDGDTPGALPCQFLDHGTGYLAAAAALDGLHRQRAEGGTHVRTLSLARTAMWLSASGADQSPDPTPTSGQPEEWAVELTGTFQASAVGPPGVIDGVPLRWPGAPARYLSDHPQW